MQNGNQDLPQQLVHQLNVLRSDMLQLEASGMLDSAGGHSEHRASAANLIRYLALRRHGIRQPNGRCGPPRHLGDCALITAL
jgi:hypothetical protein